MKEWINNNWEKVIPMVITTLMAVLSVTYAVTNYLNDLENKTQENSRVLKSINKQLDDLNDIKMKIQKLEIVHSNLKNIVREIKDTRSNTPLNNNTYVEYYSYERHALQKNKSGKLINSNKPLSQEEKDELINTYRKQQNTN